MTNAHLKEPGTITVIRAPHDKDHPYFAMSRAVAQKKELSWEALGMLTYLLSKPSDWEVRPEDLQKKGCGRDKVYKILDELKRAGHLQRERVQKEDGTFEWRPYRVFEHPLPEKPEVVAGSPFPDLPDTVSPDTAKPDISLHSREFTNHRKTEKATSVPSGTEASGDASSTPPAVFEEMAGVSAIGVAPEQASPTIPPSPPQPPASPAKRRRKAARRYDVKHPTLVEGVKKAIAAAFVEHGIWSVGDVGKGEWAQCEHAACDLCDRENPVQPEEVGALVKYVKEIAVKQEWTDWGPGALDKRVATWRQHQNQPEPPRKYPVIKFEEPDPDVKWVDREKVEAVKRELNAAFSMPLPEGFDR